MDETLSKIQQNELLQQIKDEYTTWLNYVQPKRNQIIKRLEKHIKQNKQPWLLNINLIDDTIGTLIAGSYIDEPQVKFASRDMFLENEQADTLNNMYDFDWREMSYQQVDYQIRRDRYFFGLGIAYRHGFDNTLKAPIFYSVNPMTAIFDPSPTLTGKYSANNYKYFGFLMTASMFDMKNDPQYDKDALRQLTKNSIDTDKELLEQAQAISDNTNWVADNLMFNYSVDIYHHFTIYNWKKYIITTNVEKNLILRLVELQPVLEEEKKNPALIPRPLALYFYKPERWKVFGVSIPDLLEDKEEAKTVLINASLVKARLESFGGRFIVNSRLVKNKEDILKPSAWPKYIFTNDRLQPWESLANVMQELPVSTVKQDVWNMTQLIDSEAAKDTRLDRMQMGLVPDKTMTKAEQQSIQGNANLFIGLDLKTFLWWAYDFAFLRWRTYQEYFSKSDEKFILMEQDFEKRSISITKDKFKTKQNPFIRVWARSDIEALTEKQKQFRQMMLPVIINDPEIPAYSKLLAKRFSAKINGMPQNIVNQIYGLLPSERKAKQIVDFYLNDNEIPKNLFKDPNLDYNILWVYCQKAEKTEATEKVMRVLEQYLIDHWGQQQMQMPQWPEQWAGNEQAASANNIMMSQAAGEQKGDNIISRKWVF